MQSLMTTRAPLARAPESSVRMFVGLIRPPTRVPVWTLERSAAVMNQEPNTMPGWVPLAIALVPTTAVESPGTAVRESDGTVLVTEESAGTAAALESLVAGVVVGDSDDGLSLSSPAHPAANVRAAMAINWIRAQVQTR